MSTYTAHENGQNDFDAITARRYGNAFRVPAMWLLLGEGPKTLPPKSASPRIMSFEEFEAESLPIMRGEVPPSLIPAGRDFSLARVDGFVQAGAFLQIDTIADEEGEVISAPRDPEFPFARQIAYRAKGDSMNKAEPKPIRDGDYLICLDFGDTGLEPDDGMIVVVQQTINGGMLRERSVKELVLFDDRAEFQPKSDNPVHKPIVVPRNLDPDDGREVAILALLRFVFDNKPLPIGRKR